MERDGVEEEGCVSLISVWRKLEVVRTYKMLNLIGDSLHKQPVSGETSPLTVRMRDPLDASDCWGVSPRGLTFDPPLRGSCYDLLVMTFYTHRP